MALKESHKQTRFLRRTARLRVARAVHKVDSEKPYIVPREPRMSSQEAIDSAFKQYDEALRNLAKHKPV